VSIVLLGTAVGGTLTALRTSIVSSDLGADHAKAHAWLLAAEDEIHQTEYKSCADLDAAAIKGFYDDAVQDAQAPPGWEATGGVGVNIVWFWSKVDGQEQWGDECRIGFSAQLVEIYVLSPGGGLGKTLQVVKSG
jgi:hypothetical protein